MSIGIGDDLQMLHATVQRFATEYCGSAAVREAADAADQALPPFWAAAAELGWMGLSLPEELGGQGGGMVEAAVVLEELASRTAPGPLLPTVWGAAVLARALATSRPASAKGNEEAGAEAVAPSGPGKLAALVADLASGARVATVALPAPGRGAPPGSLEGGRDGAGLHLAPADAGRHADVSSDGVGHAGRDDDAGHAVAGDAADSGALPRVSGVIGPVLCAEVADVLILPAVTVAHEPDEVWCLVDVADPGVTVRPVDPLDPTRGLADVELDSVVVEVLATVSRAEVEAIGVTLAAAEASGVAAWCVETASDYARVRRQFGRPIGQFQAVKHRCADMLVRLEQARAVAWDAAVALDADEPHGPDAHLATNVAGAVALDACVEVAKDCIQVLGGIGFTWEHDAHLHLRRAVALRQLFGGAEPWRAATARAALGGTRRQLRLDLPAEAEEHRAAIAAVVDGIAERPKDQRRGPLADAGLIVPHWPAPWGRDADAVQQLVIDQEMRRARVRAPHLQVGAWAAPTIAAHGTPEQQERWVRPTLHGEITWCQLFSEPEAGSDLAALTTAATRTEGGWSLTGQKVWTTMAAEADWGICLARTAPDAPKHLGITYFVVDMATPGIDIRPLRELTGLEMFNEVFLDDVFVPDDCVIGEVDGGWPLARTTLANERVSMGSGSSFGGGIETLVTLVGERLDDGRLHADALVLDRLGALVAEAHSVAVMGLRSTMRSVSGARPGPEASVRKLLGVEHDQRTQELGLALLGPEGATTIGAAAGWTFGFLANRCLTIAGGTSEIQRNVIGERLLGLPRDPEPTR